MNKNFIAEFFKPSDNFKTGTAIEIDSDGEYLRYQETGQRVSKLCKIYFNRGGEPFFNKRGSRQYLKEFYPIAF